MRLQYLGDWFTQLSVVTPFQGPGTACQRAQYGVHPNGTLSVYNIGIDPDGGVSEICGWAAQVYRGPGKSMQILLSNSQAGPGRTVKQEQEEISRNHVQTFSGGSVDDFFR